MRTLLVLVPERVLDVADATARAPVCARLDRFGRF
jgi:hypothetical protein